MYYLDAEKLANQACLNALNGKASVEELDQALQTFMDSRENRYRQHGYWVHSLSHFTDKLWELGSLDWIKRFNEVAFTGANELGDPSCSDRLVTDFAKNAPFDFDPAEFHLTTENLRWMKWDEYNEYEKARLDHGRFESDNALQQFKLVRRLRDPKASFVAWSNEGQANLVNVDKLRAALQELQALEADMSEFEGLERRMLEAQLVQLEAEMAQVPSKNPEHQEKVRLRLEKAIAVTKAALDNVA